LDQLRKHQSNDKTYPNSLFRHVDQIMNFCKDTIQAKTTYAIAAIDNMNLLSESDLSDLSRWLRIIHVSISHLFLAVILSFPKSLDHASTSSTLNKPLNAELSTLAIWPFLQPFISEERFMDTWTIWQSTWYDFVEDNSDSSGSLATNIIPWFEWKWCTENL
jgi:hypothetical protein